MKSVEQPKTLLQHAKAPEPRVDLSDASLILIDYQKEYTHGTLPLCGSDEALTVAQRLLARFRAEGAPVFHVVHHARPGSVLFDPETELTDIADPVAPISGEATVIKRLPSAFSGTMLEAEIRATGRTQVVILGFMTHMCVDSTARTAAELGFQVIVVDDACATRDLPDPHDARRSVSAEVLHKTSLAALADRFAAIVTSADILEPDLGTQDKAGHK